HEAGRADVAAGLELLFTWGEEVGHRGAKAFDRSLARSRYGFVLDALMRVGSIVVAAPTYGTPCGGRSYVRARHTSPPSSLGRAGPCRTQRAQGGRDRAVLVPPDPTPMSENPSRATVPMKDPCGYPFLLSFRRRRVR